MKRLVLILSFLIVLFASAPAHAFWLVYHKPAYNGRVIDAETKEPIEGAVVVVEYEKETVGVPEHYSSVIEVKETLTDKNGEFHIPSYTTIIQPLSIEGWATFIIYKPGYASFPGYILDQKYQVSAPLKHNMPLDAIEEFFSRPLGETGEIKWDLGKATVTFGVVELPKLQTRDERRINISSVSPSPDEFLEKRKNLLRLINEEEESLGLQKSDPFKAREFLRRGK